jgi:hypothetical protein
MKATAIGRSWKYSMPELTSEPDSTGGENKKNKNEVHIFRMTN